MHSLLWYSLIKEHHIRQHTFINSTNFLITSTSDSKEWAQASIENISALSIATIHQIMQWIGFTYQCCFYQSLIFCSTAPPMVIPFLTSCEDLELALMLSLTHSLLLMYSPLLSTITYTIRWCIHISCDHLINDGLHVWFVLLISIQ